MFTAPRKKPKISQHDLIAVYRKALQQGMKVDEIEKKINTYVSRLVVSEIIEEKEREIFKIMIENLRG